MATGTNTPDLDGETLVQYLSKLQFNAAKWAYMKMHGGITDEDAAAKLFADRQLKAARIEAYIAQHYTPKVNKPPHSVDITNADVKEKPTNRKETAIEYFELELRPGDVVLLSMMLTEKIKETYNKLHARHIIRKDGQPNKNSKHTSEYEGGLLEDYYRLRNLNSEVERFMAKII